MRQSSNGAIPGGAAGHGEMLNETGPGQYKVLGLLSVDTVAAYQLQGFKVLEASADGVVFDLADAEIKGSAAVALLISWQRKAHQLGRPVTIKNASEQLLEMAGISGVREIIAFE